MKRENQLFKAYSGYKIWDYIKHLMTSIVISRVEAAPDIGNRDYHITEVDDKEVEVKLIDIDEIVDFKESIELIEEGLELQNNDTFHYMEKYIDVLELLEDMQIDSNYFVLNSPDYLSVAILIIKYFKFKKEEVTEKEFEGLMDLARGFKEVFKVMITKIEE